MRTACRHAPPRHTRAPALPQPPFQVVALQLKLASDLVESQAHCLPQPQAEQLLGWALKLLTQYSESNLWQVRFGRLNMSYMYPIVILRI